MYVFVADIASLAEKYPDLLVPDEGAEYDKLVEINLTEVHQLDRLSVNELCHSLPPSFPPLAGATGKRSLHT